jgi:hypothetical protein
MTLPRMAFDPVILQTFDIIQALKEVRKVPRAAALVKSILQRHIGSRFNGLTI